MKIIKQFPMLLLIAIFLISCRTSTNKEYPTNNLEKNIEDNPNLEKKRMEIKFKFYSYDWYETKERKS